MGELNIIPGYLCNMSCAHCLNDSGPTRHDSNLSKTEIEVITQQIQITRPTKLTFTGGEPTLYIENLNIFISAHPCLEQCEVKITTNGKFATTVDRAIDVLLKIESLDTVQMSFDTFHNAFNLERNLKNLAAAAKSLGIRFQIATTVSDVIQIAKISSLVSDPNIRIVFQAAVHAGRSKSTGSSFEYDSFQRSVLDQKCPNLGSFSYIPKRGFTTCCSSLIFNSTSSDLAHNTIREHVESEFYQTLSNQTFGEIAKSKNINVQNLKANCSLACNLCDHIFNSGENL